MKNSKQDRIAIVAQKKGSKKIDVHQSMSVHSKYKLTDFLPTTKKEVELRGWDQLDIILFSGDAYIDHPAFGAAVIGRTLEAAGYKVAIVPQPDWHGDFRDFKKLDGEQIHS